ncbi:MAG: tetratricopeptide repeat protein [Pseudomonadota bacterium]
MTIEDSWKQAASGASRKSLDLYEIALQELLCYRSDPVATVEAALEDSPTFVMGHAMKAWLYLLGTEPDGLPVARDSLRTAEGLPATTREKAHLKAASLLADGKWHAAGWVLEDIVHEHPHDLLALQSGHLVDFYTGNSRMLRDRIARVLPAWDRQQPGYHGVLGMQAFGLEETADYGRAEAYGRRALELERRDAWAQHAVAHVMEMQNRYDDGIAWMTADSDAWSQDNFFAVHNWWHLSLFHLEQGDFDRVLDLYDGPIAGNGSQVILDLVDASALLWRLHLRGLNLGERWSALAETWAPLVKTPNYAFNDAHAAMAFVGAGRDDLMDELLDMQVVAIESEADNAHFTRVVGRPLCLALKAFGEGDYPAALRLLRPVRNQAARFGGSHAQRDIIDLTMIEAALRGGADTLASALIAERAFLRPDSPLTALFLNRSENLRKAA